MAGDGKVRWALVGTSEFTVDRMAPAIAASERATLVAVVSRDRGRARAVAGRFNAEHHVTSVGELGPGAVDAVHLVVPNQLHLPLTLEATRRGLHVLVEKPMAPSTTEARAMVRAAREAGVVLAVGHCMAWAPSIVAAQQLIDAGRIGRPVWRPSPCLPTRLGRGRGDRRRTTSTRVCSATSTLEIAGFRRATSGTLSQERTEWR